ncbi:MAG: hypothetical protein KKF48_01625 [Nanoarchaeota archaeon]|nr:hypothetical protein [Nanoarchaeota archaeon]MBU1027720.1 hypothetical protein [Nanoarchaeota archaeon]
MENFKIINDHKNSLFNRREIKASLESGVAPSRQDVLKLLSEKFSVQAENIKIKNILGKFGSKIFVINTNIYASEKDKNNIEKKKKKDSKIVSAEKKILEEKSVEEKTESAEQIPKKNATDIDIDKKEINKEEQVKDNNPNQSSEASEIKQEEVEEKK